MTTLTRTNQAIKKRYIADMVTFAATNLPQVDPKTLNTFLAMVNVGGTHGDLDPVDILLKMRLTLRHMPQGCPNSLLILADLLEISDIPSPALTARSEGNVEQAAQAEAQSIFNFGQTLVWQ